MFGNSQTFIYLFTKHLKLKAMSNYPKTIEEFAIENFSHNLKRIEKESNLMFPRKKDKIALMMNTLRNIIDSESLLYAKIGDGDFNTSIHYDAIRIYKLELIKIITEL